MSYSKIVLELAEDIINDRRNTAEKKREANHKEVVAKIPAIAEYETQLAQTGLDIVKGIAMGKDAKQYIKELSEINLRIQGLIKAELVNNGFASDYLATPYTCKKCEDTGYVGGYSCECRNLLLKELAVAQLNKVCPATQCTFENFNLDYYPNTQDEETGIATRERMGDIVNYCKDYANGFGEHVESILMQGRTGIGKTHLSIAIASQVSAKGYNVIYGSAMNLLSELEREKFSNNNTGEAEARMMNCDLLIIDDLGSEFCTQFTVAALYNLINTRINMNRPVIISTNLSDEEIEKKYTERILSRIIGNYTILCFIGEDIRQIKKEEEN